MVAANISIWQMWANSIQSAPPHSHEELLNSGPPPHLMHMFLRASTSESERRESLQQGLLVTDYLLASYIGHLTMVRKDFDKLRQDMNRGFDFMDTRLSVMEEVLNSNRRLVQAMNSSVTPSPNEVSVQEEPLITDI